MVQTTNLLSSGPTRKVTEMQCFNFPGRRREKGERKGKKRNKKKGRIRKGREREREGNRREEKNKKQGEKGIVFGSIVGGEIRTKHRSVLQRSFALSQISSDIQFEMDFSTLMQVHYIFCLCLKKNSKKGEGGWLATRKEFSLALLTPI